MIADNIKSEYNWKDVKIPYYWNIKLPKLLLMNIEGDKVLDVGCGNGYFVLYLIKHGIDAYGIDSGKKGIEIAKTACEGENRFYVCDIRDHKLPKEIDQKYDTVVSTEVIEHLFDPDEYLTFCYDILKKDGRIVLTTPYHGYLKNVAISMTNKWDEHHFSLFYGGHIKFFSKKTLQIIMERNGFEVTHIRGIGRFPFLWETMMAVGKRI